MNSLKLSKQHPLPYSFICTLHSQAFDLSQRFKRYPASFFCLRSLADVKCQPSKSLLRCRPFHLRPHSHFTPSMTTSGFSVPPTSLLKNQEATLCMLLNSDTLNWRHTVLLRKEQYKQTNNVRNIYWKFTSEDSNEKHLLPLLSAHLLLSAAQHLELCLILHTNVFRLEWKNCCVASALYLYSRTHSFNGF